MSLLPQDPYTKFDKLIGLIRYEFESGILFVAKVLDGAVDLLLVIPWLPFAVIIGSAAAIIFTLTF